MANKQPRKPHGQRNCEVCETEFSYFHINQVRCKACQAEYWNKRNRDKRWHVQCNQCGTNFTARNHDARKCEYCQKTVICLICGTHTNRTGYGQIYCSKWCRQVTQQDHHYNGNYSAVMQRDNFKCRRCGDNEKLSVHHIDHSGEGLKENRANNNLENLIVLCSKCHAEYHQNITRFLVQKYLEEVKQFLSEFAEGK